ncbi:phage protein D [Kribbella orskensis]|uniref:Phage protein D n=1 Tax=Kribbella orskensis TaxID=2512216 RepID=A0ABY2BAF9_9ACTN|nr:MULTISPECIES: contractile injection system protein, VgrG/Pvc8 family [Kribbella]TCN32776.1 phage protein D [Kribbella sp. VKM Ac-2500]TCO12906.1 phage protein D [Kribbella orskensis]
MTELLISAVGPVFTVDGRLVRELARDCVRLEVSEGIEGLRTLQAHFLATGGDATGPPQPLLHLDGRELDFGRSMRVSLGPDRGQRFVFEGTVSAIELVLGDGEPPRVVVLAEDALMRLRMTRRMRTYTDLSDADIAREIAGLHGLQAEAGADGPTYDVVQQLNQSDLAFLRERARLVQAEIWAAGRTLHFRSRPQRTGTSLTLVHGNDLLSVRLCADLAEQRSACIVTGYDAAAQGVIDEEAGPDVVAAESIGGRTGAALVESALGKSTTYRVREAALTSAEAVAWARAEMLRRGRRFVTVTGTTRGSADMEVGSRLRLALVGAPFEGGGYYVTRVTHTFDNVQGFRTRFEAERSTLNEVA